MGYLLIRCQEDGLEKQRGCGEKTNLIVKLFRSFGHVNILLLKETDVALYGISCLTIKN